jgi:hypothetical protein
MCSWTGERPRTEDDFLYGMEAARTDKVDGKLFLYPGRIAAEYIPHRASSFVGFHLPTIYRGYAEEKRRAVSPESSGKRGKGTINTSSLRFIS